MSDFKSTLEPDLKDKYELLKRIEELEESEKELKRKLAICEGYLKKVFECDMCVHHSRSEAECEDNCKYEIRYE